MQNGVGETSYKSIPRNWKLIDFARERANYKDEIESGP